MKKKIVTSVISFHLRDTFCSIKKYAISSKLLFNHTFHFSTICNSFRSNVKSPLPCANSNKAQTKFNIKKKEKKKTDLTLAPLCARANWASGESLNRARLLN